MGNLGYKPLDSRTLNETFQKIPVKNPEKIHEELLALGIKGKFLEQLEGMFVSIRATTSEIMEIKPQIVAANSRINSQSELSNQTKTTLAMMKEVA